MNNYERNRNPEKGLVKGLMDSMKGTVKSSPLKRNLAGEYGKRHWLLGLKEEFEAQYPEGLDKKEYLNAVREFRKRHYEELPEEERLQWVERYDQELKETAMLNTSSNDNKHSRANQYVKGRFSSFLC